mmetsp:Transcript_113465/g.275616  ORF Transcript_113465/g.275616 Transcript_113465/m.275616 type:complete len:233 (-) Transcript_113465:19-717(-)
MSPMPKSMGPPCGTVGGCSSTGAAALAGATPTKLEATEGGAVPATSPAGMAGTTGSGGPVAPAMAAKEGSEQASASAMEASCSSSMAEAAAEAKSKSPVKKPCGRLAAAAATAAPVGAGGSPSAGLRVLARSVSSISRWPFSVVVNPKRSDRSARTACKPVFFFMPSKRPLACNSDHAERIACGPCSGEFKEVNSVRPYGKACKCLQTSRNKVSFKRPIARAQRLVEGPLGR